jgi:hypothetical protein
LVFPRTRTRAAVVSTSNAQISVYKFVLQQNKLELLEETADSKARAGKAQDGLRILIVSENKKMLFKKRHFIMVSEILVKEKRRHFERTQDRTKGDPNGQMWVKKLIIIIKDQNSKTKMNTRAYK